MINADAFASMVKITLDSYLQGEIKDDSVDLAGEVQLFVAKTHDELRQWTEELAAGVMSRVDYATLVRGQAALAELRSLKTLGLPEARLDEIRHGMMETVVQAAFRLLS